MGRVVTVASQKGGVGKTATAVNLGASLAAAGKAVLLIDFDPQANASSGVGFGRAGAATDQEASLARGFLSQAIQGKALAPLVRRTQFENLSAIVSSPDLSALDVIQRAQRSAGREFRARVRELAAAFDLTIFDCPPSLHGLPVIALAASDLVLVPIQCEYYAMEGLSQIMPVIKEIHSETNRDLEIGGLLMTMYSDELQLSREVEAEIRGYFKELVLRTVIPRDVVVAEAASYGLPALRYAPLSRGAWGYLELAKEIVTRGWT